MPSFRAKRGIPLELVANEEEGFLASLGMTAVVLFVSYYSGPSNIADQRLVQAYFFPFTTNFWTRQLFMSAT